MNAKMVLHQFPRGPTIPSISVFCLKLETFLRMVGYEYECDHENWQGPAGKAPWMKIGDEEVWDSQGIIDLLAKRNPERADFDADLTTQQKATGHAIRLMLEREIYFITAIERFEDPHREWMDKNFMRVPGVPGFIQGPVRRYLGRRMKNRVPDLMKMTREERIQTAYDCFQV